MITRLSELYALWNMSVEMKHLLQEGILTPEHAFWVDELIRDRLLPRTPIPLSSAPSAYLTPMLVVSATELRTEAVGLVDAWALPDFALGSVLGEREGDVYRRYLGAVTASRHQRMNREGQPFFWNTVVRPLLHGSPPVIAPRPPWHGKASASGDDAITDVAHVRRHR